MTGRRAIVGLCMLCALAFSAFAAQGATAASNGTTAFTCKKKAVEGGVGFSKEHCKTADAVGSGAKYEHVAFAANTTTKLTGSNTTTETVRDLAILKSFQAGIEEELQAKVVEGEGWMENKVDAGTGEHYAVGEGTITYKEVTVTKPAGKGCEVWEDVEPEKVMGAIGTVKTKPLKATTLGQGDFVKFEPASGTVFATFFVTNCSTPALNGTYEVTGSLKAPADGATINANHSEITTQGNLKVRGQKAGLEGTLTLIAKDPEIPGDEYRPLSTTTVATP